VNVRWIWWVAVGGCAWVDQEDLDARILEICADDPDAPGCPTDSPTPTDVPTPTGSSTPPPTVDCYLDGDGDGFGAGDPVAREVCGIGEVADGSDCDDAAPLVNPEATEVCGNGIDDDCDGAQPDDSPGFADADGDGFGDASRATDACDTTVAVVATGTDCDDADPDVNPGASDICGNGVDDDCDGAQPDETQGFADDDGDSYGDVTEPRLVCEAGAVVFNADDCDDTDVTIFPGASELCGDGIDQDCSGADTPSVPLFADLDEDGFGDAFDLSGSTGCPDAPAFATNNDDCDDTTDAVRPNAAEVCDNSIDDDCDGATDEAPIWYVDGDGDGDGDEDDPGVSSCTQPPTSSPTNDDCDDTDPTVNGSADEIPGNGVDDDCDGFEDCYEDGDGDGFGSDVLVPSLAGDVSCSSGGVASVSGDCDDGVAAVNPNAIETCDGTDTDCNGTIDDAADQPTWYADADGDTYGANGAGVTQCAAPNPTDVQRDGDCDDAAVDVNPGAPEVCGDGTDQNCDGVDAASTYYLDADGDGQGGATTESTCGTPSPGYIAIGGDCDDDDTNVFEGRTVTPADVADPKDNDCDGFAECFRDADDDGYGAEAALVVDGLDLTCDGVRVSTTADDCNDNVATVNVGGDETAGNNIDEDCDDLRLCFVDGDGDGFAGSSTALTTDPTIDCTASGFGLVANDCDDTLVTVNPAAVEIPNNALDDDCRDGWSCSADNDNDGAVSVSAFANFAAPCAVLPDDCDDNAPDRYPGNTEVCDGVDNDCVDGVPANEADDDGDLVRICDGDCDDEDPTAYTGATEVDGSSTDEDCDGFLSCFVDGDDDGYGTSATGLVSAVDATSCDTTGFSSLATDCDDLEADRNPGFTTELCDGLDNDCDEIVPPNEADDDGDLVRVCAGDCDDTDGTTHPGAVQLCDGIDNTCDGDLAADIGLVHIEAADGGVRFPTSVNHAFEELNPERMVAGETLYVCPADTNGEAWAMQTIDPPSFDIVGVEVDGNVPVIGVDSSGGFHIPLVWSTTSSAPTYRFRSIAIDGGSLAIELDGACVHLDGSGTIETDGVAFRNCVAEDISNVGIPYGGGAVFLGPGTTGRFQDSLFENNRSNDGPGGAVLCDGCTEFYSFQTSYIENFGRQTAGAVTLWDPGPTSKIEIGTFRGNTGVNGAGGMFVDADFSLDGVRFIDNFGRRVGGLHVAGDSTNIAGIDLLFQGNARALGFDGGHALLVDDTARMGMNNAIFRDHVGIPIRVESERSPNGLVMMGTSTINSGTHYAIELAASLTGIRIDVSTTTFGNATDQVRVDTLTPQFYGGLGADFQCNTGGGLPWCF
jgi:hypothetical protein